MRADKFMPVFWLDAAQVLDAAKASGHRVLAVDEAGEGSHFAADLTGARVFVVGSENGGIPPEGLARCDARIRVPMGGFIPRYNLPAPGSAGALGRVAQGGAGGGGRLRRLGNPPRARAGR